jgi:hypothetical protein
MLRRRCVKKQVKLPERDKIWDGQILAKKEDSSDENAYGDVYGEQMLGPGFAYFVVASISMPKLFLMKVGKLLLLLQLYRPPYPLSL